MGVAVAGSTMHFLVALVLLFLTLVFSGVREPNRWAVGTLAPGSAAQNAGLQVGDRILAVGGVAVSTHEQMAEQARKLAGRETTLDIERDGRRQTLDLRITPRLPVYGTIGEDLIVFERAVGELGVSVAEGGAIEAQGLRDGDVIVRAGGTDVATIDELRTALEAPGFRTDGRLTLNVERDGTPRSTSAPACSRERSSDSSVWARRSCLDASRSPRPCRNRFGRSGRPSRCRCRGWHGSSSRRRSGGSSSGRSRPDRANRAGRPCRRRPTARAPPTWNATAIA